MEAKDAPIVFAVSNSKDGIAVDSADTATITLADIAFGAPREKTSEEKALAALAANTAGGNFGWAGTPSVGTDKFVVTGHPSDWGTSWGVPEFSWKKAAIEELIDLGFGTISFNVQLANASYYLGIYISSAEGNYLTSDRDISVYTHSWGYKIHYVPNGATVTLDLDYVLAAMNVKDASLIFAVSNKNDGIAVDSADSSKIIFSDIIFEAAREKTVEEKAFDILTNGENYSGDDNAVGWASSVSSSGGNVVINATTSWGLSAFGWKKEAIQSLIDLGVETLTFDVELASANYYFGVYISSKDGYVVADNITLYNHEWGYKVHMMPNSSTITLDLEAVLTAMESAGVMYLRFVVSDGAEWTNTGATTITLSNISFGIGAPKTAEEKAFDILTTGSNYNGDAYAYGYAGSVAGVDDDIVINAVCPSGGLAGFSIKREAIQALKDLGYKTFTFTVSLENENYCLDMYVSGPQTAYLTGEGFVAKGNNRNHYISNGARVTADIDLLLQAIDANTTGAYVKFVVVNGADWVSTNSSTVVTLSDVSFETATNV